MDHDQFIELVRQRAGVPASRRLDAMPLSDTEMAEILTRATLQVLAQRISGGQARDLALQLPPGVDVWLQPEREKAEPFDLEVFIQRVADRALVDFDAARAGVRAVFQTLRDAVTGNEWKDVLSELPREYTALLEETD
ncbi:DUF2267 domain-containing protein [Geodermatophilus ruber]|uniref:Uncharacterized conserved protein, DUF2267 family n=1 Tax=Geodermatophilus ruber TaxID=504800 RepID=A0A1I4F701_9ACTN|nr:DUF2267 domain-containing protein [Geodermatophilus ruber]SFL13684.1 Uncharacterized conserved protein, DUF2267 family [Geodermatophilus ruber]